ncbi:MAG: glutamate--tRNA ligase [bacterium]|nr:glutamate--tRNA ligase [bacterium]
MNAIKDPKKPRVRFSPSPTGFLHIGSLRTALYNYLFARKFGGVLLLRIEDTDQARSVPGGVENIIRTLEWAGIECGEGPYLKSTVNSKQFTVNEKGNYGPYVQSARLDIYKKYAEELLEKGSAYICTCTSERLEEVRKNQIANKQAPRYDGKCRDGVASESSRQNGTYVIRLKVPKTGETTFTDLVHGEMSFENKLIDDQVLMKSDGYPTYHLANVVDDHLMEITDIMRGEEWLSSTPKHVLLYNAFEWKPPKFAHLPLLLNADHSKLSKRQGDVAVDDYIKKGYLPEALLNFVALLSWNPRADKELYTVDELMAEFDIAKVNKSGAVVNFEKLDWMNGCYIRKKPLEELVELAMPYLPTNDKKLAKEVIALEQERLKKLSDLKGATEYFFVDQPLYESAILVWKKMKKESVVPNLTGLHIFLSQYTGIWDAENLECEIKVWIEGDSRGVGEVLWPMRVALSGATASAPPFQIATILGKEKTLQRIQYAIELAKKL